MSEKKHHWSGEVFVGLMFIGMGLGFIFGDVAAGLFLGMGVGFILASLIRVEREKPKITIKPSSLWIGLSSTIVGLVFILMGLSQLGIIHVNMGYLWGLVFIMAGVGLIFGGLSLIMGKKH